MAKATVISVRAASAADIERNSLQAVVMFCAIGLLLSLSVVILDQYIPGDWF
jgi:uncharacterized MnhB-related membrane protein